MESLGKLSRFRPLVVFCQDLNVHTKEAEILSQLSMMWWDLPGLVTPTAHKSSMHGEAESRKRAEYVGDLFLLRGFSAKALNKNQFFVPGGLFLQAMDWCTN